ncbi:MAG: ECF-type sigma factor [Pseudomonadota bacterium]
MGTVFGMSEVNAEQARPLLAAWRAGDEGARDSLFSLFYDELRAVSAALLRGEGNVSLSTGDLVNEAVIRLVGLNQIDWQDKAHFMALAARMMRRVLIDHARKKNAGRRDHFRITLITGLHHGQEAIDLQRLDEALIRLKGIDPVRAEIVELRYFGGLTVEETGEVVGQSPSSVKRSWRAARAWLSAALSEDFGD